MKDSNRLVPLADALSDHSAESIGILTGEPGVRFTLFIYIMIALVLVALAWSFFGRADVIVTEQGTLAPDSDIQRFYAPLDGELVNLYVAEGQPVTKGDVLARLDSRGAVDRGQRHAGTAEAGERGTGVAGVSGKRRCWSRRPR